MRTKYIKFLAFMLCMGAFLFPAMANASQIGSQPTVTVAVEDETLRIEAYGGFLGIEAIFINEQRFNYRVDDVLRLDLLAFRDIDTLSVYAVDFAGNVSNIESIANPYYSGLQPSPQLDPPQEIPVRPANPFTPDGHASVLDNASNDDEKEFFTFTTPAGNVFFLVVDRQRGSDNVYFLNDVTEQDLIALAGQPGVEVSGDAGIPVSAEPQDQDEQSDTTQEEPEDHRVDNGSGNGTLLFILVAVGIAGFVGYYLKIVRPKQQGQSSYYDDEDEDDLGDEMEFEDETDDEDDRDDDYYNTDNDEPKVEDDGL